MDKKEVACKSCGEMFFIDIQPVIVRELCRCGLTQDVRIVRALLTAVVCVFLIWLGGCWVSHHFVTEQVKAMPGGFKLEKSKESFPGHPNYEMVPKEEEKKK